MKVVPIVLLALGIFGAADAATAQVDSPPRPSRVELCGVKSTVWPNTSGSLTQAALAFNAVARIGRPDRLSVTISGGPTYYRLSGDVQPLGFTTFPLGGHSVLFQDDYRLALALEPSHALGWDAGGDFNAAVGRRAAIIMGYRYFAGPRATSR